MREVKLIIFDFDGVLSNSLLVHLKFLRSVFKLFTLPKVSGIKENGKKISASLMDNFIKKLMRISSMRIPNNILKKMIDKYNSGFAKKYSARMFKGVGETLKELEDLGFILAIVSFNTFANIKRILGHYYNCFKHILTLDNFYGDKVEKIEEILLKESLSPEQTIFVGDMEADHKAARKTKVAFIGVNYGWKNFSKKEPFPVFETTKGLSDFLVSLKQASKWQSQIRFTIFEGGNND